MPRLQIFQWKAEVACREQAVQTKPLKRYGNQRQKLPSANLPEDRPEEDRDALMAEGENEVALMVEQENQDAPMAVDEADEELDVSPITTGLVLTYY